MTGWKPMLHCTASSVFQGYEALIPPYLSAIQPRVNPGLCFPGPSGRRMKWRTTGPIRSVCPKRSPISAHFERKLVLDRSFLVPRDRSPIVLVLELLLDFLVVRSVSGSKTALNTYKRLALLTCLSRAVIFPEMPIYLSLQKTDGFSHILDPIHPVLD
jgi:hypothetical protein